MHKSSRFAGDGQIEFPEETDNFLKTIVLCATRALSAAASEVGKWMVLCGSDLPLLSDGRVMYGGPWGRNDLFGS